MLDIVIFCGATAGNPDLNPIVLIGEKRFSVQEKTHAELQAGLHQCSAMPLLFCKGLAIAFTSRRHTRFLPGALKPA